MYWLPNLFLTMNLSKRNLMENFGEAERPKGYLQTSL